MNASDAGSHRDPREHSSLYEKVLAHAGSASGPLTPGVPRSSASVVLWRQPERAGLQVYWVRRAETLRFMGGWRAFPGGGVAPEDNALELHGAPRGTGHQNPARRDSLSDNRWQTLAACALRELFEEAGILVAQEASAMRTPAFLERMRAARRKLLENSAQFHELLNELRVRPDASRLVFAGRWITPGFSPIRFDTRFFLLEWPRSEPQQPEIVPGELTAGEWISPRQALDRWRRAEVLIAQPTLHILRVLSAHGAVSGLDALRRTPDLDSEIPPVELRPGVTMLPLAAPTLPPATHTNAYLLGTRDMVLVDPGSPWEEEIRKLKTTLASLAAGDGQRITAIWLTHHHRDHVGGVEAMREFLGVPVCAHTLTAQRLKAMGIAVDREITGGQTMRLDGDPPLVLRALHTPGHAPGHLCFFDEGLKSLLAGDMLSGASTIVIDPPEGDMSDYLASLQTLIDLNPKTLFPSHGPPITEPIAKLQETVSHRLWREEKILEAWNNGPRDPLQMLPAVYADVAPAAYPLAERQLIAHLDRLRRLGRIDR